MGLEPPFEAFMESRNGVGRIVLSGELDMATVPGLEDPLACLVGDVVSAIMLDLRDVAFLDSSAIHAFVRAKALTEASGQELILMGVSDRARRLFQLTGTQLLLDGHDAAAVIDRFTGWDAGSGADDPVDGEPDA